MGARVAFAVVVMCLAATNGSAQTGLRSASLPDRTPTAPMPAPMTLPSGSLPARTPHQPIPPTAGDQFLAEPDTYRPDPRPSRRRYFYGYPLAYGPYVVTASEARGAEVADGYLHLQVQPGSAQVFVDGYYMGSVEDFRRIIPGRALQAGAHRIEVRAPGYQTRSFEVMIPPKETVSYRADLEPSGESVRAVAATPAMAKTFYVIPGCYAGDKPPRGKLPRGCEAAKVRVVPPKSVTGKTR